MKEGLPVNYIVIGYIKVTKAADSQLSIVATPVTYGSTISGKYNQAIGPRVILKIALLMKRHKTMRIF
jgi:hypothetical protein